MPFGIDQRRGRDVRQIARRIRLVIVTIVLVGWPSSVYLFRTLRGLPFRTIHIVLMACGYTTAIGVCVATCWFGMRSGIRALEQMRG